LHTVQAFEQSNPIFTPQTSVSTLKYAPPNSVPIKTFHFSVNTSTAFGGGGAGKALMQPLTISRQIDTNSPILFGKMVVGLQLSRMVITTVQIDISGKPSSLVYTMEPVRILSLSQDQTLTEYLSLEFQSMGMSFKDPVTGNTASVTFDQSQQIIV